MERKAVDRIIDAVGPKYTPANLDRKKLRHDLEWAGTWYRTRVSLREKAKRDRRIEAALKAAKRFQQARTALKEGDLLEIDLCLQKEGSLAKALQYFVDQAVSALKPSLPGPEWQQDTAAQMAKELHLGERGPFAWLVGVHLPQVFEAFFQKSAGFSRGSASKAGGPYIRFAERALIELGITNSGKPYEPEAIADALTDARKGRSRRKLGKRNKNRRLPNDVLHEPWGTRRHSQRRRKIVEDVPTTARLAPLGLSVEKAAAAAGIGRTKIYEAIKLGKLKARKAGRHTVILTDDLKTFLVSLPVKERD